MFLAKTLVRDCRHKFRIVPGTLLYIQYGRRREGPAFHPPCSSPRSLPHSLQNSTLPLSRVRRSELPSPEPGPGSFCTGPELWRALSFTEAARQAGFVLLCASSSASPIAVTLSVNSSVVGTSPTVVGVNHGAQQEESYSLAAVQCCLAARHACSRM